MLKISHSKFELDLSNYDISIVEENSWFADRFFTRFTLPFNFLITDELNDAMGDILSHNSETAETYFDVYFYDNGEEYEAIFEIQDIKGREASGTVSFGLEEIPNYDKKLSELPLDDFAIEAPDTIYTHAASVITKTWPEVSHNFVQVHTDAFDAEDPQWEFFEGVLNKRTGNSFVENAYDAENDKQQNRNVMQPQAYMGHVLTKAVQDAGFEIAGNLLEDTEFKKALFSEISSYYSTINVDAEELRLHSGEHHTLVNSYYGSYTKILTFTEPGRYKIAGNIFMNFAVKRAYVRLRYKGKDVFHSVKKAGFFRKGRWFQRYTFSIDANIDFSQGDDGILEFTSHQYIYNVVDNEYLENQPILDLSITQLSKFDANGDTVPTLVAPAEIKLNKCVPDITVGDFITFLKNWKNIDLEPKGKTLYFNFIENQTNTENALDLSDFEEKDPLRTSNQSKSYHIKYQDITSEDYNFEAIFVDNEGASSIVKETDTTSPIIIKAIPLPVINRGNVVTAHHFMDDTSLIKILLYDGGNALVNFAEDPNAILIPQLYEKHFAQWIDFRINSRSYKWAFKMTNEQKSQLYLRRKLYAYENRHVIKSINRDLVRPGLWMIELETGTIL